jgi:hypothetical protein
MKKEEIIAQNSQRGARILEQMRHEAKEKWVKVDFKTDLPPLSLSASVQFFNSLFNT